VTAAPKCPACGHSAHPGECKRRGRGRCVPLGPGMIACGVRPQCRCPWRSCRCGTAVAATILLPPEARFAPDGEVVLVPVIRGTARDPAGRLAVWKLDDGYLASRELADGEAPGRREWRGIEHVCAYEPAEVPS
jgi:hypothetical protein